MINLLTKYKIQLHHLDFMKYFWKKKGDPLKIGLHTKIICDRIDKAIADFDEGKSTNLIIKVPFRHGKSDIISRYEPAHFIGNHPDCDVMIVTYAASLAIGFSKFGRDLVKSSEYKEIFDKDISDTNSSVDSWGLKNGIGVVTASGLSSGITGKGYHLGILDDYCAGRSEAESQTIRDKTWDAFTNDFITRAAPVSITIILATPWHIDDVIGRIEQYTNSESEKYDPNFPVFEILSFPAKNGKVKIKNNNNIEETVEYDYLFTKKKLSTGESFDERFSADWYEKKFAILGSYSSSALLQCNPQRRGGNLIDTSKIKYYDTDEDFPKTKYYRVWDLAHTAKQTNKDDPDYTSGTLLTYTKDNGEWHLWIKNVCRMRGKSPERDNFIRAATDKDGMNVPVAIENSLDSKDAINNLHSILKGKRMLLPINISIDKIARVGYVEPIFEAGHVHILRGDWNLEWLNEVQAFPSGSHDDQIDNITAGYMLLCNSNSNKVSTGRVVGV